MLKSDIKACKAWNFWCCTESIEARMTEGSYLHEEEIISQCRPVVSSPPSYSEPRSVPCYVSEPLAARSFPYDIIYLPLGFSDSALTPGSSLPSNSSKLAPPPVET